MDTLEPLVRRSTYIMVFAPDKCDPARRKMNPVGFEVPVPESLAVGTSRFATPVAHARSVLIHAISAGRGGPLGRPFGSWYTGRYIAAPRTSHPQTRVLTPLSSMGHFMQWPAISRASRTRRGAQVRCGGRDDMRGVFADAKDEA